MRKEILELRDKGYTYNQIVEVLGCSKSTVSYHCGEGQKDKTFKRNLDLKSNLIYKVKAKVDTFIGRIKNNSIAFNKIYVKRDDNHEELVNKVINNPICYLTGRKINLEDSKSYHLDHIIPYSISEDNSIKNLGVACKEANMAKSDLPLEDFLSLCKEVLENNGYKVIKNK